MEKRAFVIEYPQGTDKGFDGYRPDTKPILRAIKEEKGMETEVVFYRPDRKDELENYLKDNAEIVISRINPGNLKEVDDYFQFLKRVGEAGVAVHTHPDVMINLDFKDILAKLKDTVLGEQTTHFYHDVEDFKAGFPGELEREGTRVLKINYGSTGEGVYLVTLNDDGTVKSTEAVNNDKTSFDSLDAFMSDFVTKFEDEDEGAVYFKGKKGFVSCKYLKRIAEGEIRVLLVKGDVIAVVHKVPQEGEFSATLFSGAQYKYESPNEPKWAEVVQISKDGLKEIEKYCDDKPFPLLWTLDFILDYDADGNDVYVLSEINCSCVGITTELQYAKDVAQHA